MRCLDIGRAYRGRRCVTALTHESHIRSYGLGTMTLFRAVPLSVHGALEIFAAPALIAAPFLLGFDPATGAVSLALGAMLIGLALSTHGETRTLPISTHVAFDYVIAFLLIASGFAFGLANGDTQATVFLAGFGAAHMALTASTRFSVRGA